MPKPVFKVVLIMYLDILDSLILLFTNDSLLNDKNKK